MRVIPSTSSLLSFWQQLVFTEAALLAHPDTAPFAAPFTQLLEAFQALHTSDLATRRALIQAQARSVIGDQDLDEGLRKLHSDALNAVTQDRAQSVFKALFASDLWETIRFALARQIEVTRTIIGNLGLSIIPEPLKAHGPKLQALVDAGVAILEGKKKAAFARTEANLGSTQWKDDVNAVRLTAYGALLGLAARTKRPKSWAEAFFMGAPEAKESIDVDTDAGAAPGGSPAPSEPDATS